MTCSCGHGVCECGDVCFCCSSTCYCSVCTYLRYRMRGECHQCGGRGPRCHLLPKSNFQTHRQQSSRRASDKRANIGKYAPEAQQGSSTASGRWVPERSRTPPRESPSSDEELMFQMDDIDPPPETSNTSTGARRKVFSGSSHFSSNMSASGTIPLEQCEQPSRVRRLYHPITDADRLKWRESTKYKMKKTDDSLHLRESSRENEMPVTTKDVAACSRNNPGTNLSEIEERVTSSDAFVITDFNRANQLEREMPTTIQDVPGSAHHNPSANISKVEESQVSRLSSEPKLGATGLKWTESPESEMMINKDIPGCSYDYKSVSKQEEYKVTDSVLYAESQIEDEYASESLPSLPTSSEDSSTSSHSVSSPSPQLSTSAPAIYDLPQPTELKCSKQKTSTVLDTSRLSPTSNLSKFEAVRISDSPQSRTSSDSSSIEVLPENMSNGARYDTFHGQPSIPSTFAASSQLESSVVPVDSSEPGTSQMQQTSNSLKVQSPEVPKSARQTSSESD